MSYQQRIQEFTSRCILVLLRKKMRLSFRELVHLFEIIPTTVCLQLFVCILLLQGLDFEVVMSDFEENLDKKSFNSPVEYALENARNKALAVMWKHIKDEVCDFLTALCKTVAYWRDVPFCLCLSACYASELQIYVHVICVQKLFRWSITGKILLWMLKFVTIFWQICLSISMIAHVITF